MLPFRASHIDFACTLFQLSSGGKATTCARYEEPLYGRHMMSHRVHRCNRSRKDSSFVHNHESLPSNQSVL